MLLLGCHQWQSSLGPLLTQVRFGGTSLEPRFLVAVLVKKWGLLLTCWKADHTGANAQTIVLDSSWANIERILAPTLLQNRRSSLCSRIRHTALRFLVVLHATLYDCHYFVFKLSFFIDWRVSTALGTTSFVVLRGQGWHLKRERKQRNILFDVVRLSWHVPVEVFLQGLAIWPIVKELMLVLVIMRHRRWLMKEFKYYVS